METNLYYFTVVADEMNITRAANRLFISQQALSKHLARLESEYNIVLFERTPRLRLTVAGAHLLEYAKQVIEMEQNVLHTINDSHVKNRTKLPFGTSSRKGYIIAPHVLRRYNELYPDVLPSIYDGTKEFLDMLLSQGRIDLYFRMQGKEDYTGKFLTLQKEELYFIVSKALLIKTLGEDKWKSFLYEHRDGITVSDICRFPLLFPNEGSSLYETLSMYFRKYPIHIVAELNHYAAAIASTHLGYCACFETKSFYYDYVQRAPILADDTFPLKILDIEGISKFGVVYNPSLEKDRHVMDFIELSKTATKELEERTEEFLKKKKELIEDLG